MTFAELEQEISKYYPSWGMRINANGRVKLCEIYVPSREFQGFGPTVTDALADAVESLRETVNRELYARYDV